MKVLFLQKDVWAKTGIMSLSAVIKKEGYECDLLVDDLEKNIIKKTREINPDIIAFSITTGEHLWMNGIGKQLRGFFDKTIVCGGPHPTFYPEIISEDYLDAICIGEGEEAFLEFIQAVDAGTDTTRILNFIVKKEGNTFRNEVRPLIQDLDSLPFFDRDIYNRYKLYRVPHGSILFHNVVITNRGCPYNCAFCFNKAYTQLYKGKGKVFRRRSVSNVIQELVELKQKNKVKFIDFEDDSFTLPLPSREWLIDFWELYQKEVGLPFKMLTRADLLDEDMINRLKEAKCYSIKMGVESGNERYRNDVYQKHMLDKDIIQAASLFKKYGIKFQTYNIMGGPGETLDMAFETYDLNRKIRPDFVWCALLNPYPRTDIYDYSLKHNYLEDGFDFQDIGNSFFFNTPMKIENKKEVSNLQKIMYLSILLHLPRIFVVFLTKLPITKLYSLLFGVTFFIGLYRINKVSLFDLSRLSLTRFLKYVKLS